jgi:hypothetical protein
VLAGNTTVRPLSTDFTRFTVPAPPIDPTGARTNALGGVTTVIGHEGATMTKVGDHYVHLGTA